MPKTDKNLEESRNFIQGLLLKKFGQKVEAARLEKAATELCEAIPDRQAA